MSKWFAGLSEEQVAAASHRGSSALLLACPGSGKTKTTVARFGYLLEQEAISAEEVLLCTFSKKAAEEIHQRSLKMGIRPVKEEQRLSKTLHALCYHLLKQEWSSVREVKGASSKTFEIAKPWPFVALLKNYHPERDPLAYFQEWEKVKEFGYKLDPANSTHREMWRYWQAMEQWRRSLPVTLLTFSDLQLWALDLLEYRPEIAKKWQAKWAHVMIDEAQDTSDIQWSLINHLSRPESLFIVGDENQSIYGFRAAVPQNFLEFANRPGCKVYSLSTNYRSHDRIVEAANKLIASTRSPLKKEMRPHKEGGAALDYFKASDAQQEAFEVITRIKKLKESDPDLKWGQIAVISRTNAPLESYERLFDECGIPFTRLGAHSNFYSRASVQEVIKTLTRYQEKLLPPTLQEKFLRVNQSPASLINAVISGPGKLKEKWSEKSEDDIPEEDWAQLVQVALGFDTLEAFLEKVKYWQTLRSSEEKDMHHVSITTAHQAKGLEWDHVFCVAMCDLQIPHPRAQDKEEEKRILYVMITRAAKALCLSNPSNLFGKKTKPSPLILPLYS